MRGEMVIRIKLQAEDGILATILADERKLTLDEYFADLVRKDAQSLVKRTGGAVERIEVHNDAANQH